MGHIQLEAGRQVKQLMHHASCITNSSMWEGGRKWVISKHSLSDASSVMHDVREGEQRVGYADGLVWRDRSPDASHTNGGYSKRQGAGRRVAGSECMWPADSLF